MRRIPVWFVHASYWLLFVLLLMVFYFFAVFVPAHVGAGRHANVRVIFWCRLMAGFAIVPGIISFYAAYGYLFDRFLSKRLFKLFITGSLLTALVASLCGAALASLPYLFGPAFLFGDGYSSAILVILLMTAISWVNGIAGAVIRGCLTWYKEIRLKEELRQKNMETELALVKSQIDPHFLFNTINNIDILISRDAAAASAYLNKLSGLMRFLLYETKADFVPLERELDYLQQYIDLQKIRTNNIDYVDLEINGEISGQMIAPMILLPFVENAFKHTESRKTSSQIRIRLQLSKDRLLFSCKNTRHLQQPADDHKGLGNSLIIKRLELLYPGRYQLNINGAMQLYRVDLELKL